MDRHASANRQAAAIASADGGQALAVEVNGLVTKIDHTLIHDGLNLTLPAGEILGLVGETGGGKSVFLETLIGLRRPLAGSIRVFGQDPYDVAKNSAADIRRTWGVLFQSGALFSNLTVLENVAFVAREQASLSEELSTHPGKAAGRFRRQLPGRPRWPSTSMGGVRRASMRDGR